MFLLTRCTLFIYLSKPRTKIFFHNVSQFRDGKYTAHVDDVRHLRPARLHATKIVFYFTDTVVAASPRRKRTSFLFLESNLARIFTTKFLYLSYSSYLFYSIYINSLYHYEVYTSSYIFLLIM